MEEIAKVFGIDWRLIIIQAVNFGLIIFILSKFLYTPIMRIIEERRKIIEKGVQDASEAEKKLAESEVASLEIHAKAKEKSEVMLSEALESAKKVKEDSLIEAEAEKVRIIDDARKKAESIQKESLHASKEIVAKLAVLEAEKILRAKTK